MITQNSRAAHSYNGDVFNDIEDILKGIFSPKQVMMNTDSDRKLAIDLIEKEAAFELKADIPGVDKNDITITLENGILNISVDANKTVHDQANQVFIINERRHNRFSRSVNLGKTVDENSINANFVDGVLTLSLSKLKQHQPKKININV